MWSYRFVYVCISRVWQLKAPKCLLPLAEEDEDGITLDLRGMNLTDDEAN